MKPIKSLKNQSACIFLIFIALLLQNCNPDPDFDPIKGPKGRPVYKPNVYIYPETNIDLSVNIEFPLGGEIIASIPEYGTGWMVNVDSNGLIDNKYSYLFYESIQPDVWQNVTGWNVKQAELKSFFEGNLKAYGFIEPEIKDFTEYWIPRLNEFKYYNIYPQTEETIERAVLLNLSEKPDHILRLYYLIEGCNKRIDKISEPEIKAFQRSGFVVTEWGVVL